MNAYGLQTRTITATCEALFGELLAMLEAKHHVPKLPCNEQGHSGYSSGSVRARTLAMFDDDVEITSPDVANHFGITTHNAGNVLTQLCGDGYIRINGKKRKRTGPPINVYKRAVAA